MPRYSVQAHDPRTSYSAVPHGPALHPARKPNTRSALLRFSFLRIAFLRLTLACALGSLTSLHALPFNQPITRTLTSADGKTAELVIHGITGDQLIVQSPADATARVQVPLARLSETDRQELETLRAAIIAGEHAYETTPFITEICRDFWVDGGGDPAWTEPTPELWARTPYFIFINGADNFDFRLYPFTGHRKPRINDTPVLLTYGTMRGRLRELSVLLALEKCPPNSAVLKIEKTSRLIRFFNAIPVRDHLPPAEAAASLWRDYKSQIPSYWPALPRITASNYQGLHLGPMAYVLRRDGSIATLRGKPLVGDLQVIVKALENYYAEVD